MRSAPEGRSAARRSRSFALAVAGCVAGLCCAGCREAPSPPRDGGNETAGSTRPAPTFDLETLRPVPDGEALTQAIERATSWVAALEVDPLRLRRERGMQGSKHLSEKLFLFYNRYRNETEPDRRRRHLERFRSSFEAAAGRDAYHRIRDDDPRSFGREIMPYVDACSMASEMGLESERCRTTIAALLPRIRADMAERNTAWRMVLSHFLQRLDLEPPESMQEMYSGSLLEARPPVDTLLKSQIYELTHEVFAWAEYGSRSLDRMPGEARDYLSRSLPRLVERAVRRRDPDMLAELLLCLAWNGQAGTPHYGEGINYLLAGQNPDGSFGDYEERRARLAAQGSDWDVATGSYLHTTGVAAWALLDALRRAGQRSP